MRRILFFNKLSSDPRKFFAVLISVLTVIFAHSSVKADGVRSALLATSAPAPVVEESDILLKLPYQFYYLTDKTDSDGIEGRQLHCYYPNTEVDVTLDLFIPSIFGYVEAIWHYPDNDHTFIAVNEGGNEIRELSLYAISHKNEILPIIKLDGYLPTKYNDYDESQMCGIKVFKDKVHIKGCISGTTLDQYLTLGLNLLPLLPPSEISIPPCHIKAIKVNTSGVNIRREAGTNAGIWGYIDDPYDWGSCEERETIWSDFCDNKTRFKAIHPEKGEIFIGPADNKAPNGWQPIYILASDNTKTGYISSRFVDVIETVDITPGMTLFDQWWGPQIKYINSGKYKGLWIYYIIGMEGEETMLFGKTVDGKIVFYGKCDGPYYNRQTPDMKGIQLDSGKLLFGDELGLSNSVDVLDINKLSEKDLDTIFSVAKYTEGEDQSVIIKFPDNANAHFFLIPAK